VATWNELLERAEPAEHVVHLYGENDALLTASVSRYLGEGLRRGDGLLVIATKDHTDAIKRELELADPARTPAAIAEGRLVFLDAGITLARIMDGELRWERFERTIAPALDEVRARSHCSAVRAFGEMVGLLWVAGQFAAASQLEDFWNRLMQEHAIALFCAYPVDIYNGDCSMAALSTILGAHTHMYAGPGTLLSSGRSVA
jgi:hypothetical protein